MSRWCGDTLRLNVLDYRKVVGYEKVCTTSMPVSLAGYHGCDRLW